MEFSRTAAQGIDKIPAMIAYWNSSRRCEFANAAYLDWFGRDPQEMASLDMEELLGPLYARNLPYILGVLRGEPQTFERRITLPDGTGRETVATYVPDVVDGVVQGFWAHVADVTVLREREAALERTLAELRAAKREIRQLQGLLPICAGCKAIRDDEGNWQRLEAYVEARTEATFTHTMCPCCMQKWYPTPPA